MAEAVFRSQVKAAGLTDEIEVDSAGIGAWHSGQHAHQGTLRVLKAHGIGYNGRARQVRLTDIPRSDYVLAMDNENLTSLQRMVPNKTNIQLFLQAAFDKGLVSEQEIPDPYYTGKFDDAYTLIETGATALLEKIRAERGI
jgi:protein-tyrosine phosphatase